MSEEQEFYVGQIFEGIYPPEAASYCNMNRKIIMELSPSENGKPRYQIQDIPEPSPVEKARMDMFTNEDYLRRTDWYVIREADNGVATPEDIKSKREEAREKISELRAFLAEHEDEEPQTPFFQ